jgi:hypothetical protein
MFESSRRTYFMSTLEVRYNGKWQTFSVEDGKSDVLRTAANLDTGEIVSYLGKQLQGKRLKPGSARYQEVSRLARDCLGLPQVWTGD